MNQKPCPTTREQLLASFAAAEKRIASSGALILNAASLAGFALTRTDGQSITRAYALLPDTDHPLYARARSLLDSVATEERASFTVDVGRELEDCLG